MKNNYEIAKEVIAGLWGNGQERVQRLANGGYDPVAVQSIVNALMKDRETRTDTASADGNYLTVECDLTKYHGIILKLKE